MAALRAVDTLEKVWALPFIQRQTSKTRDKKNQKKNSRKKKKNSSLFLPFLMGYIEEETLVGAAEA